MRVRYSLLHSWGQICTGMVMVTNGIKIYPSILSWASWPMGAFLFSMGVITQRRVFFEVFENRVEFLSPFFPSRGRQARPLESIDAGSFFYRWVAKRPDFKRFVAWRDVERR